MKMFAVLYTEDCQRVLIDRDAQVAWPERSWQATATPPVQDEETAMHWCDEHGYPPGAWASENAPAHGQPIQHKRTITTVVIRGGDEVEVTSETRSR